MVSITRSVTAALLAGAMALPAQAETLKFAHVYESAEPYHQWALWAAEQIAERTNGRYEIEVYPASSLGSEVELNEGLTFGSVDMIYTGALFAASNYGPIAISDAPYIMRDYEHWKAYTDSDLFHELAQEYESVTSNHVMGLVYHGQRHVTANKPILTPKDMYKLKIRVPNAKLFHLFTDPLGANATPIAFAEVYLALQQGVVDAQENPLLTIKSKRFYEVQSDISLTGHITNSLLVLMSGPTWAGLSEKDQKIFTEVFQEANSRMSDEVRSQEGELIEWFRGQGIAVHEVDRAAFREAVLPALTREDAPWTHEQYERMLKIGQ